VLAREAQRRTCLLTRFVRDPLEETVMSCA
jgi:hypothetical protein